MSTIDELSKLLESASVHADKALFALKKQNYGDFQDELFFSRMFLSMFRERLRNEED